jgi:hypothetical protein
MLIYKIVHNEYCGIGDEEWGLNHWKIGDWKATCATLPRSDRHRRPASLQLGAGRRPVGARPQGAKARGKFGGLQMVGAWRRPSCPSLPTTDSVCSSGRCRRPTPLGLQREHGASVELPGAASSRERPRGRGCRRPFWIEVGARVVGLRGFLGRGGAN